MSLGCRVLGFVAVALATAGGIGCAPAQPAESSSTEHPGQNEQGDQGSFGDTWLEVCNHGWMLLYHDFRDQNGNWLGGGWDLLAAYGIVPSVEGVDYDWWYCDHQE